VNPVTLAELPHHVSSHVVPGAGVLGTRVTQP
ncbi:uncharacterized protein METZ01_LOCUS407640, partial [marine metagenome]